MSKIKRFLWFDAQAEEAPNFYVSIFNDSKIVNVNRYWQAGPGPKGSVMSVVFQLDGREFIALSGGPLFKFTEAISLIVHSKTQEGVDTDWARLLEGAKKASVAGSRTNTACHGNSFPRSWAKCLATPILRKPNESWKPWGKPCPRLHG